MSIEDSRYAAFLVFLAIVVGTAFALAVNTTKEVTVGFYAFSGGVAATFILMYLYPIVKALISPDYRYRGDIGQTILRGRGGELPTPKKRDLDDMVRRSSI